MLLTDSRQSYLDHVATLKARLDSETAVRTAIGGEFVAMGTLERELLRCLGLSDGQCVVDVGCGSGRLAYQLARYEHLHYVGLDVVPDLVDHAAKVSRRPDWQFSVTEGTAIPVGAEQADFVCFFSVFTHLVHEQSFRYLREAKRVLRPGGRIVFSFLEFRIPCHWEQFQHSNQHSNAAQHLNQFIDREAIQVWAERLGLTVELLADGDLPHIPLGSDLRFESGHVMHGMGNLGQSVAVLRKPRPAVEPNLAGPATTSTGSGNVALDIECVRPSPALGKAAVPQASSPSFPGTDAEVAPGSRRSLDGGLPAHGAARTTSSIAISARSYVGRGESALILGFNVGSRSQRVLIRALGPGLAVHGVNEPLARPEFEVRDAHGNLVATGTDTRAEQPAQHEAMAAACRAARLPETAPGDAALLIQLAPGVYTVVVRGRNGTTGNALAEVYAIDAG